MGGGGDAQGYDDRLAAVMGMRERANGVTRRGHKQHSLNVLEKTRFLEVFNFFKCQSVIQL